jgi:hypothetical protein
MPENLAKSTRKNPLPTKISYRQLNPGENLTRTITLNISVGKIESVKLKQDI